MRDRGASFAFRFGQAGGFSVGWLEAPSNPLASNTLIGDRHTATVNGWQRQPQSCCPVVPCCRLSWPVCRRSAILGRIIEGACPDVIQHILHVIYVIVFLVDIIINIFNITNKTT